MLHTNIKSPLPTSPPLTQVLSALCELLSAAPMEDGDSVHRALVALGTVCHEDAELCGLAKEMGVQVRGRGMVRGGARSWLEHQAGCRADSRQAANLPIRTSLPPRRSSFPATLQTLHTSTPAGCFADSGRVP